MRWNAGCKKYTSKGISKEDVATNFEQYGKIITTRDNVYKGGIGVFYQDQ